MERQEILDGLNESLGELFEDDSIQVEEDSSFQNVLKWSNLTTDGLAEANNVDGKMFGTEHILEELNTDPYRTPEEIICDMKEAVDEYVGGRESFDDLTMVSFAYYGITT